jgi:hypothetical protein
MKYYFLSPLTIDECAKKFTQYIDDHPLHFSSRFPLTLVGEIDGCEFTLRTSSHSNPNLFRGALHSRQTGTLIEGNFHMHWAPKIAVGGIVGSSVAFSCVLGGSIVVNAIGLFAILNTSAQPGENMVSFLGLALVIGLLLPLGFTVSALIFFLAAIVSRKSWQSTDITYITKFMEKRLQARRVGSDQQTGGFISE